ncbi:MAG: hypothetical protein PHR11_06535 [Candidatus Omnitrophica bacterium]|nr:hypothetical protein [Candidatus Omnitrophota bacterium]
MFTKEDYQDYFTLIQSAETKMAAYLSGFIDLVEDRELKDALQRVLSDENRHIILSRELLRLLD